MHRSHSSSSAHGRSLNRRAAGLMLAVLTLTWLLIGHSPVLAQESDTTATDTDSHTYKIQIDHHGIRIEGDNSSSATDSGNSGIRVGVGQRHVFRELGTDIVRFGEDVTVEEGDLVRGDIVVFGGDVTVSGKVLGNVVVMVGNANILDSAEVDEDVVVLGGVLDADPSAQILGERVMVKELRFGDLSLFKGLPPVFRFLVVPVQFFISLILSWLIILFMRDRVVRTQEHVNESVLKSFGVGFLTWLAGVIVVPVLTFVLIVTLIGIPLALMLVLTCVALFIVSRTVFVYHLGLKVMDKMNVQSENPFGIVLIGTAVLYLPALLGYGVSVWPLGSPVGVLFKFLGVLFSVFASLVGLGALFMSRLGSRPAGRQGTPPLPAAPAAAEPV